MGYDYSKKLSAEGQQHSNACWAASISWWMSAMALHSKRVPYKQTDLLVDFNQHALAAGGSVSPTEMKKVCQSAKIRIDLKFMPPAELKNSTIDSPCLIIFKYPAAGGTHMNVIFDKQGDTVMCMEPFYPLTAAADGTRKGAYIRRPLSFFAQTPEIGFGTLPLKDCMNGTEEAR